MTQQVLSATGAIRETSASSYTGTYRKVTARTVTNSVAATDLLNGEITIAANALSATGIIRVTAWGTYTNNSGAAQLSNRYALLLGGTTLIDAGVSAGTLYLASAEIQVWRISVIIQAQNATNSQFVRWEQQDKTIFSTQPAWLFATGTGINYSLPSVGGYGGLISHGYNTTALDMTTSKTLVLNLTQPVAHATYTTTLNGALVEII